MVHSEKYETYITSQFIVLVNSIDQLGSQSLSRSETNDIFIL